MNRREQAIEAVRQVLASQPDVRWGYVFGSVTRHDHFRDVDVAIMPSPTMPTGAVAFGALIARLEAATGRQVDLVDLQQPDLPLLGSLLAERVVVLDREPQCRRTWEAETASLWLDFRPSHEEFLRVRNLAMQRRLQGKS
ncbi:MAG: nucleotidyltransferase domain-containing protein [Planctomycetes bacterium]|nr:nucleotidyltransferase domain-containing protein [Planctomycetota bacterium]MCC7398570.1 nucleotidyltransferase domain-containing protein [Planctomycetota bacterium]